MKKNALFLLPQNAKFDDITLKGGKTEGRNVPHKKTFAGVVNFKILAFHLTKG